MLFVEDTQKQHLYSTWAVCHICQELGTVLRALQRLIHLILTIRFQRKHLLRILAPEHQALSMLKFLIYKMGLYLHKTSVRSSIHFKSSLGYLDIYNNVSAIEIVGLFRYRDMKFMHVGRHRDIPEDFSLHNQLNAEMQRDNLI